MCGAYQGAPLASSPAICTHIRRSCVCFHRQTLQLTTQKCNLQKKSFYRLGQCFKCQRLNWYFQTWWLPSMDQSYKTFFGSSTLGQAPGLTHKHQNRLERLGKDKHSSLVRKFVNYGRKKFYSIGPSDLCYKNFYGSNYCHFVISYSVGDCQQFPPQSNSCGNPEALWDSTLVDSSLARKYKTKVKGLDRHFQTYFITTLKSFIVQAHWQPTW